MKYYKNLETGVIWSASDLDLVSRLETDKNYIIIPIIKGAADIEAAGPSILPKENPTNGPEYPGMFKNKILEDKEDQFKNEGLKELKKPKKKRGVKDGKVQTD